MCPGWKPALPEQLGLGVQSPAEGEDHAARSNAAVKRTQASPAAVPCNRHRRSGTRRHSSDLDHARLRVRSSATARQRGATDWFRTWPPARCGREAGELHAIHYPSARRKNAIAPISSTILTRDAAQHARGRWRYKGSAARASGRRRAFPVRQSRPSSLQVRSNCAGDVPQLPGKSQLSTSSS